MSELNNENIYTYMYKIPNKIVSTFVEKLLTCRIIFKVIFTFLGLDYRDDSPMIDLSFYESVFQKSDHHAKFEIDRTILTCLN